MRPREVTTRPPMHATPPPRAAYRTPSTPDADTFDPDALVEVIGTWDDDAVLTVAHLGDGERFLVAPHLLPDGLGARTHALVTVRGDAVTVAPLDGPRFALQVAVTVTVGRVRFAVRRVPRGEAIAPPRRGRFVGATGAFALAFTALLALAPRPCRRISPRACRSRQTCCPPCCRCCCEREGMEFEMCTVAFSPFALSRDW